MRKECLYTLSSSVAHWKWNEWRSVLDGITGVQKNVGGNGPQWCITFQKLTTIRNLNGYLNNSTLMASGTYYYSSEYEGGKQLRTETGFVIIKCDSQQTNQVEKRKAGLALRYTCFIKKLTTNRSVE